MDTKTKTAICLRVDEELHRALKLNKLASGVPIEVFIRRAIKLALYADRKVETRG